jgi:hypothetical protein
VVTVARETGWSYHDIMWTIPLSAITQICDYILWDKGADLRWIDHGVDIDAILNG